MQAPDLWNAITEIDMRLADPSLPNPEPYALQERLCEARRNWRMFIIKTFARGSEPKYRPTPSPVTIRIDTS